jgi:hypothetical protein
LPIEEVFRAKKPYAKPILSRIKTNDFPTLVRRNTNDAQSSSAAWADHVLIVEGYASSLLKLVESLQNYGFSLEWSCVFKAEEVLKIRPARLDPGSPAEQSAVVDLRTCTSRTESLLNWINKPFEVPPVLLALLSSRESVTPLEKNSWVSNCWRLKQLVAPRELAALLKSFLGICLAQRKSRLFEHFRVPEPLEGIARGGKES